MYKLLVNDLSNYNIYFMSKPFSEYVSKILKSDSHANI